MGHTKYFLGGTKHLIGFKVIVENKWLKMKYRNNSKYWDPDQLPQLSLI